MIKKQLLLAAGALFLLALVAVVVSRVVAQGTLAAPTITNWSSTGGHPTNKDDDQDIMYLVEENDSLTFHVAVDQTVDYEWAVNKITQTVNADTFVWSVPDDKDIWEIHLRVHNADGEDHLEWVISTLSNEEAPDFFDYFADFKYEDRIELDPWGRQLENWSRITSYGSITAEQGYMEPLKENQDGVSYKSYYGTTMPDVLYGTWILKFRFDHPHVGGGGLHTKIGWQFMSKDLVSGDNTPGHGYGWADDTHNWFSSRLKYDSADPPYPSLPSIFWSNGTLGMRGVGDSYSRMEWTTIKIIHTPDGYFRLWKGDVLLANTLVNARHIDGVSEAINHPLKQYLKSERYYLDESVYFDNITVWNEQYLFPEKNITFTTYPRYYTFSPIEPHYTTGIAIDGRDVTLKDINTSINDPDLFEYFPATQTGYLHTNLLIKGGACLTITDQTLYVDDGKEIKLENGAELYIYDATITSDGYFHWIFPSEFYFSFNEGLGGPTTYDFKGILKIYDSIIENSSYFYFVGADTIEIVNTTFKNLQDVDNSVPCTGEGMTDELCAHAGNEHSISFRNRQSMSSLKLSNISIDSSPTIRIIGGDAIIPLNIYDSDLTNTSFLIKEGLAGGQGVVRDEPMSATLNLINVKYNNATLDNYASLFNKYYLDVYVSDNNGLAVPGAIVSITNEVDASQPAKNLNEYQVWTSSFENGWYNHDIPYKKWIDAEVLTSTLAGANGHTPLPSDREYTLVIADYVKHAGGVQNFTYSITATKNGKTASMSGLDIDASWYRESPNAPTKTVVCNLDTGLCSLEDIATGAISGTVIDTNGTALVNATVAVDGTALAGETDTNGEYSIINIPIGVYTVTCTKDGHQSISEDNTVVNEGETTTVNFELDPIVEPALVLSGAPANQTIHLSWTVNTTLPVTSTWQIAYQSQSGTAYPPITNILSPTRAYTLTGLTNYTWYTVTLNAMSGSASFLADTVTVMPTGIFVYLPLVLKGQ